MKRITSIILTIILSMATNGMIRIYRKLPVTEDTKRQDR